MLWYRQATSHYLDQCRASFISPYCFTRPHWIKHILNLSFEHRLQQLNQYIRFNLSQGISKNWYMHFIFVACCRPHLPLTVAHLRALNPINHVYCLFRRSTWHARSYFHHPRFRMALYIIIKLRHGNTFVIAGEGNPQAVVKFPTQRTSDGEFRLFRYY